MGGEDLTHSSRVQPSHLASASAQQIAAQQTARGLSIAQEASSEGFQAWIDEGVFNPMIMARRFEALEIKRKRVAHEEEMEKLERKEQILEVEKVEEICEQYSRNNPELHARSLLLLRSRIAQGDKKEEILHKVLEMFPDYSLADDVLDFLLAATRDELSSEVQLAKEEINATYAREIRAGKNIAEEARAFSRQDLGQPIGLRNLYREVTGNPRDSNTLFDELTTQFHFDKMKLVIDFLLHSLGADLKAKGPSISRGELHRLFTETRKLQGILGVFVFFKSRMSLISSTFAKQGLPLPPRLTFELLSKQFMKAVQERYPSTDKILLLAAQLELSEEFFAQVIIFTQMRDAMRQVAPRLYKSEQHRQDLLHAFIEVIEELDERLEEKEE